MITIAMIAYFTIGYRVWWKIYLTPDRHGNKASLEACLLGLPICLFAGPHILLAAHIISSMFMMDMMAEQRVMDHNLDTLEDYLEQE